MDILCGKAFTIYLKIGFKNPDCRISCKYALIFTSYAYEKYDMIFKI
jgi:hypothetical protein